MEQTPISTYRDRNLTAKAWEDVNEALAPSYREMSNEDREAFGLYTVITL